MALPRHVINITIFLTLLVVIIVLAVSGAYAFLREQQVLKIARGMPYEEVVKALGEPKFDEVSRPQFEYCGQQRSQFWFKGNPAWPGLWYGRLEDNLLIAFVDGRVCAFERVGL